MKKFLVLTVAGFLTFGNYGTIFANESFKTDVEQYYIDDLRDSSYLISSTKLTGASTSKNFNVPSDYKYVKIFYDNYNSSQTVIKIKYPDGTSETFRIDGNSNNSYYINNAKSGQYTLDINILNGTSNLNGTLVVKGSDTSID